MGKGLGGTEWTVNLRDIDGDDDIRTGRATWTLPLLFARPLMSDVGMLSPRRLVAKCSLSALSTLLLVHVASSWRDVGLFGSDDIESQLLRIPSDICL